MTYYDIHPIKLHTDYFLISPNHKDIVDTVSEMLVVLHIPHNKKKDYLKLDCIYSLLEVLYKEGHEQAFDIISLIDEKKSISTLELVASAMILSAGVALFLSTPFFAGVVAFLKQFLSSPICIPVLSLAYTSTVATYSLYKNQFDNKKQLINRFRDNFFLLAASTFKLIAYEILITTSGMMTYLIGGLLVFSSMMDVFKESVSLIQEYRQYKNKPKMQESNTIILNETAIRHELIYIKRRNKLFINLSTSILLVGIVASLCFLPSSMCATIGSMAATALVYATKSLANKKNGQIMRDKLQQSLKEIRASYACQKKLSESVKQSYTLLTSSLGIRARQEEACEYGACEYGLKDLIPPILPEFGSELQQLAECAKAAP